MKQVGTGKQYLYAVVTVCEVIHGFVLFVDDAYAGFVGTNGDGFDVFGGFALLFEVGMDEFGGFDSRLRMEFG